MRLLAWFMGLVAFDVIIGGGISAALSADGWTRFDQNANDVYQAGFAMIYMATVVRLLVAKQEKIGLGLMTLGLTYCEDVAFYLMKPLLNWLVSWLARVPVNFEWLFPPSGIGGWLGWFDRLLGSNYKLPLLVVFALNIFGIVILWAMQETKPEE